MYLHITQVPTRLTRTTARPKNWFRRIVSNALSRAYESNKSKKSRENTTILAPWALKKAVVDLGFVNVQ